ncbi:hypothetical protein BASA50_002992 [Batrachochytrium salamandrivorans]|uniref:MIF4G domain-containing protein n=1 Tax=Batrachochytrium salamandrivorans TaxID=1357716 RepID=A0ABQ8FJP5_9FUNG|nr:hypothetical protein BASA62_004552 [Batrachochytrium salamandrivorans]KAH6599478.1 hypothetical protein BASA50_002992 [Batrachochytrium salamandrivorans]KAH6602812.1 hypothetical protein BASA61_000747 [Batrachochytrium salamandrivorans]KAH9245648.1 hypothetical protein BASA81_016855 [Batrachochytrium salamandrivorans]KAH9267573.1 hypothetical protein BASA84_000625 [Batrachochytrium salamandrivorans]
MSKIRPKPELAPTAMSAAVSTPDKDKDDDICEYQFSRRTSLRTANITHLTTPRDSTVFEKLDGSIKKNTSLIKKLKAGITAMNFAVIKKELLTLKMEKYIEEVALSISEATYKSSADVWAAIEISSLLHQRHAEFTPLLIANTMKHFGPPPTTYGLTVEQKERDEAVRLTKQRSSLRFITELYLVGIAKDSSKSKDGFIASILSELFGKDKTHANISICAAFVKFFSIYFVEKMGTPLGNSEDSENSIAPEAVTTAPKESLVPLSFRLKVCSILHVYFDSVKSQLVRDYQHMKRLEKATSDYFIARGEVYEDKQDIYEKSVKAYEKLRAYVETLSTYLFLDMPDLPEDDNSTRLGMNIMLSDGKSSRDDKDFKSGLWGDEDSKLFYESIMDLKNQVPAILLGLKHKDDKPAISSIDDDSRKSSMTLNSAETSATLSDADISGITVPEDDNTLGSDQLDSPELVLEDGAVLSAGEPGDENEKIESATSKAGLIGIITRLQNSLSREAIDQIAVEFAFQNNRGSRRRIIEALLGVSRQRLDLLPFYSRLIATLNPYMPDIGTTIIKELNRLFHSHQKRKDQMFIEEKIKNIRYIGELTKFCVTPPHVIFHVIKVLLDDFTHHNVDLLCSLLETCGRFLFYHPDTSARTAEFIDILQRKKNSHHLASRYIFMIDNALYECNPPEFIAKAKKQRPPIVMYLRKLIYRDLDLTSARNVLRLLRKANWNDELVRKTLTKLFTKIWRVKYSNLGLMAFLSSELSRFYPEFGVSVVDSCLEEVRASLEANIFKHNQRRISTAKFLGHLHTYKMVDSSVVFETLYLLLRFGHANGVPMPNVQCPLDSPNDFFRLRLVCTVLDTCGGSFKDGVDGNSLDNFISFMQMYMFTKASLPMEVEFFVDETLELLRPEIKRFKSYEESVEAVNSIVQRQSKLQSAPNVTTPLDTNSATTVTLNGDANAALSSQDADEDLHDSQGSDADDAVDSRYEEMRPEDDAEFELDDNIDAMSDDVDADAESVRDEDEEDEEVVIRMSPPPQTEEDLDFEREFSAMMLESLDSRKNERKPALFDAPIPMRHRNTTPANAALENSDDDDVPEEGYVEFTLLTRRGNKQQSKVMSLPSDSLFAMNTLSKQQAEQEEKIRLKELVLNYEEQERRSFMKDQETTNKFRYMGSAKPSNVETNESSIPGRGRGRGRGHSRGSYRVIWTSSSK